MNQLIVVEFETTASVVHSFEMWTAGCAMWWPRTHTHSGDDKTDVVFEPFAGGRIFERGPDGAEYEWGAVTLWEPPHRLEYLWHIFLDPSQATVVSVSFNETPSGSLVRLENSGFEIFAESATERIDRVGNAWRAITDSYRIMASS